MKNFAKTFLSLTLLIAPGLAYCIPTPIKGVLLNAADNDLTIVYKKEFMAEVTKKIKMDAAHRFQVDIDIDRPTQIIFRIAQNGFLAYAYPGIPITLTAELPNGDGSAKATFIGETGPVNNIFADLLVDPEFKTKRWLTGDKPLAEKRERLNEHYRFRKQFIKKRLASLQLNAASRAILSLDSVKNEYYKARAVFGYIDQYELNDDDAKKLIADELAANILQYPDKEELAIPEVHDFWCGAYVSYMVDMERRKTKDFYKLYGFYLTALNKVEQNLPQPVRDHATAYLLANLSVKPTDFRPGTDSLIRRMNAFVKTAMIPDEAKTYLAFRAENTGQDDVTMLIGMTMPQFAIKDTKGNTLQWGRFKDSLVIVDVWASWCGPCIAQFPAMEKVTAHFKGKKVSLVMICLDKAEQAWQKAMATHKLQGYQYIDTKAFDGDFADTMIIKGIPRYILVKNGRVINPDALPPSEEDMIKQISEALDD